REYHVPPAPVPRPDVEADRAIVTHTRPGARPSVNAIGAPHHPPPPVTIDDHSRSAAIPDHTPQRRPRRRPHLASIVIGRLLQHLPQDLPRVPPRRLGPRLGLGNPRKAQHAP